MIRGNKTKLSLFGLILLLMITMVLVIGCGSKASKEKESAQSQKPAQQSKASKLQDLYFVGATQGGGGVWDMIGTGLGTAMQQKLPESRVTFIPGEGLANVITLDEGKAELGLTGMLNMVAARKGEEPYKQVYDKARIVASLYGSRIQFPAMKDFPLNSFAEIKEQKKAVRMGVDERGSGPDLWTKRMLQEYGIQFEDVEAWGGKIVYKGQSAAAEMMADRLLDVFTLSGTVPAGAIQELSTTQEIKMFSLDQKVVDAMVQKYGVVPATIPKGSYKFLEKDITTFGWSTVLITHSGVPEDDVYKITKALVENLEFVKSIHANLKNITPQLMATGSGSLPLHPGAQKYYKEIGAIK